MKLTLAALPILAVSLILAHEHGPAALSCLPTARMPYEQSHAIKLSMLPYGHSIGEYELDHIVPLCMGGSNDRSNLQLQLWPDAERKDIDEAAACDLVRNGTLTCAEGQETMREWGH